MFICSSHAGVSYCNNGLSMSVLLWLRVDGLFCGLGGNSKWRVKHGFSSRACCHVRFLPSEIPFILL